MSTNKKLALAAALALITSFPRLRLLRLSITTAAHLVSKTTASDLMPATADPTR